MGIASLSCLFNVQAEMLVYCWTCSLKFRVEIWAGDIPLEILLEKWSLKL